jgi:tetratricopeptide (TPR) repeat protein
MNTISPSKIRDIDVIKLPQPIGESCRIFSNIGEDNSAEKISRLKELYEVTIKLLSSLLVKAYLTEKDNAEENSVTEKLNIRIQKLEHPSLGDWVGLLRDAVFFFKNYEGPSSFITDPIVTYYNSNLPDGRNGTVFEAYSVLAEFLNQKPSKPTIKSLIDFLVNARNKLGSGGHGASLNTIDTQKIASNLEIILHHLISNLDFFEFFELLYINSVSKTKGQTIYDAKFFSRIFITNERVTQTSAEYELCLDGEVYIAQLSSSDANTPAISKALSLSPLLVFQHCSSTKTEQLFFFNGKRGKSLEYLSYVTGSYYYPPDLEKDFDNISRVISGELRAADVFKISDPEGGRIPNSQERKKSEELAEEALLNIRQSAPKYAIKFAESALKINDNCSKAFFAKGLAYCLLGKLREASGSLESAVKLSVDNITHHTAFACILAISGKTDECLAQFRKIKKYESTNELVETIFSDSENIESNLFGDGISLEDKLSKVVKIVLKQLDEDNQEIHSWLFRLHPWKLIYLIAKNKSIPINPLIVSVVGSILLFLIPILVHYPLISLWGFTSSESVALYLRHASISIVCFFGFYNVFAFNKYLLNIYKSLRKISVIPKPALSQWYLSEMAKCWGSSNIETENKDFLSIEPLFNRDKYFFYPFVIIIILFLPLHILCSGDWNFTLSYPSELFHSLADEETLHVKISTLWAIIQFISRYLTYIFQVYLCAYGLTIILPIIAFIPRILDIPIRYYPGIPDELTLKIVSHEFLKFSILATLFCIAAAFQLFIFDCYSVVPLAAIIYVITISIFLPIYTVAPAYGILKTLKSLRSSISEEIASHIEISYSKCTIDFENKNIENLTQRIELLDKFKRLCPTWPLTKASTILMGFLLASFGTIMLALIYLTVLKEWPKF